MELLHHSITGDILDAFRTVRITFAGKRYSESNYTKALAIELRNLGHQVEKQKPIKRVYAGKSIGTGFIDLVVDGKVLIEVKVVKRFTDDHIEQVRTYLLDSGLAVGMLLNFGKPDDPKEPLFRRIFEIINAP